MLMVALLRENPGDVIGILILNYDWVNVIEHCAFVRDTGGWCCTLSRPGFDRRRGFRAIQTKCTWYIEILLIRACMKLFNSAHN